MPKPQTWDHIRSQKKPNRDTRWVCLDPEAADAYDVAARELDRAKIFASGRQGEETAAALVASQEKYDAAKAELRKKSVRFVAQALGRKKYNKLKEQHPPTDEQQEQVMEESKGAMRLTYNSDTFVPELISRTLVEPEMTAQDVRDWFDDDNWNDAEIATVVKMCFDVNSENRIVPLGKD